MRGLAGRRFLVCGGASGIGEATARRLAEEGANVVVTDRHLEAAVGLSRSLGSKAEAFSYEQSDIESVTQLFARVSDSGPLNGVAIAAGIHPGRVPLAAVTSATYTHVHGVNALGVLLVLQRAIDAVEPDGHSSIVVVSSVAGVRPAAGDAVYASSKAAAQAIVKSVALESADRGVRVNTVLPGTAITPLLVSQAPLQMIEDDAKRTIPLRRAARASEVASAIAFLLSDDASYITASELNVDGGLAAGRPG